MILRTTPQVSLDLDNQLDKNLAEYFAASGWRGGMIRVDWASVVATDYSRLAQVVFVQRGTRDAYLLCLIWTVDSEKIGSRLIYRSR